MHLHFILAMVLVIPRAGSGLKSPGISLSIIKGLLERLRNDCHKSLNGLPVVEGGCPVDFDFASICWPSTQRNRTAKSLCSSISFKHGVVERKCLPNGKWEKITYVTACKRLPFDEFQKRYNDIIFSTFESKHDEIKQEFKRHYENLRDVKNVRTLDLYMRYVNIGMCLFSLAFIFLFISSNDQRFTLHTFLILSFLLVEPFKISSELYFDHFRSQKTCSYIWVTEMYFVMVQIFMMFCEGFYQFRQFYFVFVTKSRVYKYIFFSYFIPAVIVYGVYLPLMYHFHPDPDNRFKLCWKYTVQDHKLIYILYTPMFILLFLNLLITIYMMNLIIAKLKVEKTNEFNKAIKGARGFTVLVVLLGFGYMMTLYGPEDNAPFAYFKAVVQPLQSILVCLLQVILSQQIIKGFRQKLRKILKKKKEERSFSERRMQTGSMLSRTSSSKEWSI